MPDAKLGNGWYRFPKYFLSNLCLAYRSSHRAGTLDNGKRQCGFVALLVDEALWYGFVLE